MTFDWVKMQARLDNVRVSNLNKKAMRGHLSRGVRCAVAGDVEGIRSALRAYQGERKAAFGWYTPKPFCRPHLAAVVKALTRQAWT